jgi:dTDP-4-dehydrorhamnose reductase
LLSRKDMDIADRDSVKAAMEKYQPWAVVNAAGFVKVDDAETNTAQCLRENTVGAAILASASRDIGATFLTFSTDFVFNGYQQTPYIEHDSAQPLNIYGVSKFLAESRVSNAYPSSIIVRTSSFFGPWDKYNFLAQMIEHLENGKEFNTTADFVVSPTYVPDLVNACLDLIIDKETGLWHIAHPTAITWQEFALRAAEMARLNTGMIRTLKPQQLGFRAQRPSYSALASSKGLLMPTLDSAMDRFLFEFKSAKDAIV